MRRKILNLKIEDRKTDVTIYLPDGVQPEKKALDEVRDLMGLEQTVDRLLEYGEFFGDPDSRIEEMIFTPDFHKGAGIPIGTVMMTKGFVVPQAMGNDINCGMRVYRTDLTEEAVTGSLAAITQKIRHIFFEGGRNIPMNAIQREAMFKCGLTGLLETSGEAGNAGLWELYDKNQQERELNRVAFCGSLKARAVEGLEDFIGRGKELSYDDQIGSIGGGNHFAEVQRVAEIYDGATANAWGIKKGAILFMIHSGSLTIGHHSGLINRKVCESIYPGENGGAMQKQWKGGFPRPDNKIYLIPQNERLKESWNRFRDTTNNAANFGFANRLFLGLMLGKAIGEAVGRCNFELLYDSPHNFIWNREIGGETYYIHRKGACCARGMEDMAGTPFEYYGEPVIIPGSMGSSSYLLRGLGNSESLWSASHGAGRRLSRGEAIHGSDREFEEFMRRFHVITPIDPERSDLKGRRDILKKWEETIRSEAPYAYKDIDAVVGVHKQHSMAEIVARMEPIFTVKA